MKKNKSIIISSLLVLLLVLMIIGISYATFTANLSGTPDKLKINTGYVKMNCESTTFNITNTFPMDDKTAIEATDNIAKCVLNTTMKGKMEIDYDVSLYAVIDSPSLPYNNVKMQLSKTEAGIKSYLRESTATKGVFVDTLEYGLRGHYSNRYIIDTGTITEAKTIIYNVKTWVSDEKIEPHENNYNASENCSDPAYTDKASCEKNHGVWGNSTIETYGGGEFSFKLKIETNQKSNKPAEEEEEK